MPSALLSLFQNTQALYYNLQRQQMTSPRKSLDAQKESTLFGDLSHIEKQTSRMSRQLIEDLENMKKAQGEVKELEKSGRVGTEDFRVRASTEITLLQEKIKNHLTIQKGQYSRLANQINQIMGTHKQINSQLQLLNTRFEEYHVNLLRRMTQFQQTQIFPQSQSLELSVFVNSFHYLQNQRTPMRDSDLYLAELWVGTCKLSQPINTKIALTFRIGKTIIQSPASKTIQDGSIAFNTTLQLNTDKSALETQRCSVALTYDNGTSEGGVAGIALIKIPKERCIPQKAYKLVQCRDKTAQIELSLKIVPLEENRSASPITSSSFCSIMEMNDFEKKVISPPKLFTSSDISDRSHHFKHLMPPKPRMSHEREVNPLTISIHSQAIVQDRLITLQNECNCLKKLLSIQIAKNKECSTMIDKLLEVLQRDSTCCVPNEFDDTLLIENTECVQKSLEPGEDKRDSLAEVEQLAIRNKLLLQENKELEELVFKLSDMVEKKVSQKGYIQNSKDLLVRLQQLQREVNQYKKSFENIKLQLQNLEKDSFSKLQQLEMFRSKMKIDTKFPSLRHIDLEKASSPIATIANLIEREISEKKQMIKQLLKSWRGESETVPRTNLWVRIRQKIDKAFSNLVCKRLNKDILNYEKGELLKGIEQCLLLSNKHIQY